MIENDSKVSGAIQLLWKKHKNLSYKLDENQIVLYNTYKESKEKVVVWNCARGSGKSYTLCVIAIEECIRNPKALVKYCCPKQKEASQIIQPLFRDILEDCPKDMKPTWLKGEGAWRFPNGAQIQLSGLDNGRAESLRGGSSVLCIVDEAASKSLKDLKYIVKSVLLPAVTRTKEIDGKIILASTPPVSSDHPFVFFLRKADIAGALVTRNVYTNPRMTPEMIRRIIENCGGEDSSDFRREYLCEIITDTESAVVPEFTSALRLKICREWDKPVFYDAYVAMDIGVNDLTVALFAYYDFKNAKIIVEDEVVLNGQRFNTQRLAQQLKEKEKTHFVNPLSLEEMKPYLRVSDTNLTVINDLWQLHGLFFMPTKKDESIAAVNNMRILLENEQVIINPRCTTLIRHLEQATWNKNKTSYERSADNGHFDALEALKYLCRSVQFNKNPYPAGYGTIHTDSNYSIRNKDSNSNINAIKKMFNIKR